MPEREHYQHQAHPGPPQGAGSLRGQTPGQMLFPTRITLAGKASSHKSSFPADKQHVPLHQHHQCPPPLPRPRQENHTNPIQALPRVFQGRCQGDAAFTHTHAHFQPLIYTELPGKSTAQQTSSGSSRAAGVSQRSSRGTGQEGESSVSCTHSHPMLFVRTLPAWWGRQQEHQACTWGRIQHGGAQQGPGAAIGGSALPSGCRGSAGAAARFEVCKVKREALKLFQDNFLFQTEAP